MIGPIEKDLTDEKAPDLAVEPSRRLRPKKDRPFDYRPIREGVRRWITIVLIGLVAYLVVLVSLGQTFDWMDEPQAAFLVERLLPPLLALAGAATGFYFGGRGDDDAPPND